MRVLRVSQRLYPEDTGGGAYHVHALSRDQAALGHDVTVLTVGETCSKRSRDGYDLVQKTAPIAPFGNALSPGVASVLTNISEFDIVHAHSHLYFSTNLAALARRVSNVPLAITNHGLYSQSAPSSVFGLYLRTIGRWTFDAADKVFCYTDVDERRLRELGVETDVEVVPNGIDTTQFSPDGPSHEAMTAGDPRLLFVGRLVKGKRPLDLVEAFPTVLEHNPDAHLYFCGDGPLEPTLRERARDLGVDNSISLLGHQAYDAMPSIYRAADVLVLPSRAEGLPRSVLESFACGTPAVTSELAQLVSVVSKAGQIVPIDDPGAIAEAIVDVIEANGQLTDSRDVVTGVYEWEETVQTTTEKLQELLDD